MTLAEALANRGCAHGFSHDSFEALASQVAADLRCAFDPAELDTLVEPNHQTPRTYLSHNQPAYRLPLHTDYPDRFPPPRYILLRCEQTGKDPVATVIVDAMRYIDRAPLKNVLRTEPWIISSGPGRGKTVKLLDQDKCSGRHLLRYAENVMRPLLSSGSIALSVLKELCVISPSVRKVLCRLEFIVFDNWRVLHGRDFGQDRPESWLPGQGRIMRRALLFDTASSRLAEPLFGSRASLSAQRTSRVVRCHPQLR